MWRPYKNRDKKRFKFAQKRFQNWKNLESIDCVTKYLICKHEIKSYSISDRNHYRQNAKYRNRNSAQHPVSRCRQNLCFITLFKWIGDSRKLSKRDFHWELIFSSKNQVFQYPNYKHRCYFLLEKSISKLNNVMRHCSTIFGSGLLAV